MTWRSWSRSFVAVLSCKAVPHEQAVCKSPVSYEQCQNSCIVMKHGLWVVMKGRGAHLHLRDTRKDFSKISLPEGGSIMVTGCHLD
jgi:hypothetical protein